MNSKSNVAEEKTKSVVTMSLSPTPKQKRVLKTSNTRGKLTKRSYIIPIYSRNCIQSVDRRSNIDKLNNTHLNQSSSRNQEKRINQFVQRLLNLTFTFALRVRRNTSTSKVFTSILNNPTARMIARQT